MSTYGFKDKWVAESLRRQAASSRTVRELQEYFGNTLVVKTKQDIPPRNDELVGLGSGYVHYVDDNGLLTPWTDSEGRSAEVDLINVSSGLDVPGDEYISAVRSGDRYIAMPDSSLGFCGVLCECGPYAMENPDTCDPPPVNNDCCQSACIFQETSISGLTVRSSDSDPLFAFDQVGNSEYIDSQDPGYRPGLDPHCQWLVNGRNGNGETDFVLIYVYYIAVGTWEIVWQGLPANNTVPYSDCTGTVILDSQAAFPTCRFDVDEGAPCPTCCDSWCQFLSDAIFNLVAFDGTATYVQNGSSQYDQDFCSFIVPTDGGECKVYFDHTVQTWYVDTPTGGLNGLNFVCNGIVTLNNQNSQFQVRGVDCAVAAALARAHPEVFSKKNCSRNDFQMMVSRYGRDQSREKADVLARVLQRNAPQHSIETIAQFIREALDA